LPAWSGAPTPSSPLLPIDKTPGEAYADRQLKIMR